MVDDSWPLNDGSNTDSAQHIKNGMEITENIGKKKKNYEGYGMLKNQKNGIYLTNKGYRIYRYVASEP